MLQLKLNILIQSSICNKIRTLLISGVYMEVELERFLSPYGKEINLADNGFLPDPKGEYTKYYNEFLVTFDELEKEPCLVILGEPGIGKTTLLKSEYKRLSESGVKTLWVDFRTICDSQTLKEEIFERKEVNGASAIEPLHLFLDAFDESSFMNLTDRFISELNKADLKNIFLRISGRNNFISESLARSVYIY